MTLRKFDNHCVECVDDVGVMMFSVEGNDRQFSVMNEWLKRNLVGAERSTFVIKPSFEQRIYIFEQINPTVIGFRLSFHKANLTSRTSSLWLTYCDHLTHTCRFSSVPLPKYLRREISKINDFVSDLERWCDEFGLKLIKLNEYPALDTLPLAGNYAFIYLRKQPLRIMPIIMFFETQHAALYKVRFL